MILVTTIHGSGYSWKFSSAEWSNSTLALDNLGADVGRNECLIQMGVVMSYSIHHGSHIPLSLCLVLDSPENRIQRPNSLCSILGNHHSPDSLLEGKIREQES